MPRTSGVVPGSAVVISQVHTGRYGLVELHNRGRQTAVLGNWSLQCRCRISGEWTETQGDVLVLNITIPPDGYYLVGTQKAYTFEWPLPDKLWVEARNAGFDQKGATIALLDSPEPVRLAGQSHIIDIVSWSGGGIAESAYGEQVMPAPALNESLMRSADDHFVLCEAPCPRNSRSQASGSDLPE